MSKILFIAMGVPNPQGTSALKAYAAGAPGLLIAAGGRVLERGKVVEVLLGQFQPQTLFMMEFDTVDQIKAVLARADYQALVPDRDAAFSSLSFLVVERA